jgi:hypothetical protein
MITLFIVLAVFAGAAGCQQSQTTGQEQKDLGASGSGARNQAASLAVVGGGDYNVATAAYTTVGGGYHNEASVSYATVGGGLLNSATAYRATVGGGSRNAASFFDSTVGGGSGNTASGTRSTVGGGGVNAAQGYGATVGGGSGNEVGGTHATVGGGTFNSAVGFESTIGGGAGNRAEAKQTTIGGGLDNRATDIYATVGGGFSNAAGGSYAVVPGGTLNQAGGDYSFAAGRRAKVTAEHPGAFLYADSNDADFSSTAADEFAVRATGGVRLVTAVDETGNAVSGVTLAPGSGSWSSLSDRAAKMNVVPLDEAQVLALLAEVPVSTWSYAGQDPLVRHAGPMAQDFYAAFGLGEDEKHISSVDADGVALAAIQGLYRLVQQKDAQITTLEARVATLEQSSPENGFTALPFTLGALTSLLLISSLFLAARILRPIPNLQSTNYQPKGGRS